MGRARARAHVARTGATGVRLQSRAARLVRRHRGQSRPGAPRVGPDRANLSRRSNRAPTCRLGWILRSRRGRLGRPSSLELENEGLPPPLRLLPRAPNSLLSRASGEVREAHSLSPASQDLGGRGERPNASGRTGHTGASTRTEPSLLCSRSRVLSVKPVLASVSSLLLRPPPTSWPPSSSWSRAGLGNLLLGRCSTWQGSSGSGSSPRDQRVPPSLSQPRFSRS